MKKTILLGAITALLFVQCGKDTDPFMIKNGSIGGLTKEMKIKQVDSLFSQDSIVKLSLAQGTDGTQGEVEIYEKGGKLLLLLKPENENDPNSVISDVRVFDDRYKTEKGLNLSSTFKDIKEKYTIVNMETTINAVVIFLEETDAYITIDKKDLPEGLRYDMNTKIEASQIPETAPIKYFMLGWEPTATE